MFRKMFWSWEWSDGTCSDCLKVTFKPGDAIVVETDELRFDMGVHNYNIVRILCHECAEKRAAKTKQQILSRSQVVGSR